MFKARGSVPVNVQQYIREEKRLSSAESHVKQLTRLSIICELDQASDKNFSISAQKRRNKVIEHEVKGLILHKLKERRLALSKLYQDEEKRWTEALARQSLSFVQDS
ncbi:hypothetical protein RCL1_002348 [Eukaryota sp. TZLM3-RCL]